MGFFSWKTADTDKSFIEKKIQKLRKRKMNLKAKITNISNEKTILMDHGEVADYSEALMSATLTIRIFETVIRETFHYTWIKPSLFSIELTGKQVNKAIWRLEHATEGKMKEKGNELMDAFKDEIKLLK